MKVVLGVDAGATKTFALVADEAGHILGFGQGGTGNHQVNGLDAAVAEIHRAIRGALAQANVSPPVDLGFFGLAGADLPDDYALLTPAITALKVAKEIRIKNDTMVALRAGTSRPWGVAVISGTGFNAGGIGPDGREIQFLGLGALSGDWGGAGDIAQEMLRLIVRAWDGRGQPTLLTDMILAALGVPSVEELIAQVYRGVLERRRFLDLVPLVFQAAYEGDAVARDLVIRVGTEVGVTANAIIRRLGLEKSDVEVVLGGSIFKAKGPLLLDTVTQVVHGQAPRAVIVRPRFEPVVGAVLLALEALGVEVTPEIVANLRATGKGLGLVEGEDV